MLNLASMIDVTFLLLAYFMVAMVLEQNEDHLSPTLQTQATRRRGRPATCSRRSSRSG